MAKIKTKLIPKAFAPHTAVDAYEMHEGETHYRYEPTDGEMVEVLVWERYPDYDIIFGVPARSSKRFERELVFFTIRRVTENGVHRGQYFDVKESEAMKRALDKALEFSHAHSPHLWKESAKKA